MSSAAKLRKYGRGTATVAAAALVMTSFGPAAFASWDDAPQTPTVTEASQTAGTIGIVDTDGGANNAPADNHGATLLQAGKDGQSIADARLVIPNRFKVGDKIRVRMFDRSASEEKDGNANSGPATRLAFAGAPKLEVSQAVAANTVVAPDTEDPAASNTESDANNPWVAPNPATNTIADTKPGVQPQFKVSTASSSGTAGFDDTVVLEVTSDASTGDPSGRWILSLSDLRVNVGPQVTPGEVRLVPFAANAGTKETASTWFQGNTEKDTQGTPQTTDDIAREISIYTVPAYVAPATITMDNADITADGTAQNVGALAITETQGYSLGAATYTVTFTGATIANANATSIKGEVTNGGTNEAISGITIVAPNKLQFTLNNTDDAKRSTLNFTGLMLSATSAAQIKVQLDGGTLDAWYADAGASPAVGSAIQPASWFVTEGGTDPSNIVNPATGTNTAGAVLNSTEAAKLPVGPYTVTNTAAVPNYTVTDGTGAAASGIDTSGTDFATAEITALGGAGNYTVAATAASFTNSDMVANDTANAQISAADLEKFPKVTAGTETYDVAADTTANRLQILDDAGAIVWETVAGSGTTLPLAGPTVFYNTAGTQSITVGAGLTLGSFDITTTAVPAAWTITNPDGDVWTSADGMTFLFDVNGDGDTSDAGESQTIEATTALTAGTFTVADSGTPETWSFTANGVVYTSTNQLVFTKPSTDTSSAPASITFAEAVDAGTFAIILSTVEPTELRYGVNQKDIVPPAERNLLAGVASAQSARIGGNNRYETAAKVAEMWAGGDKSVVNGKFRNAIIASGENFPDALSASYLSQRMGAPILLTQKGSIPQDTIEALRDRQVEKVFIVGGPAAISKDVQDRLAALPIYSYEDGTIKATRADLSVQRLSSANPQNDNRYTTNQLVNMYAAAWGGQRTIGKTVYKYGEAGKYTAIFARGDNFPDALAAGVLTAGTRPAVDVPYSNDQALPLVLTQPGELSNSAVAQIDNLDVQHALIIGSENAISAGVKTALENKNLTTTRLGGEDRYFTAAAVDEFAMRSNVGKATNEYPGLGFIGDPNAMGEYPDDVVSFLANGLKYPDALTAAPWIGRNYNALNLVQPTDLTGGTRDFLSKRAADVSHAIALGLGDAVATSVLTEANKIASSK